MSLLVEMENGAATLENNLAVPYKVIYTLVILEITLLDISFLEKNIGPHKTLCVNVYSSFLYNRPLLKAT